MEETTCGSLLRELQHIWDEVGESDEDRDRMLLQLEQECLEVYRRKVDQANQGRARLHRALADAEAQLADLVSRLGERPIIVENRQGTLREQFESVYPHLEEMRQKKEERTRQIADVRSQIQKIRSEIAGVPVGDPPMEEDLTLRKLEEYQLQLQTLLKEKSDRMNKVMDYVNIIHDLCSVLSLDFFKTVSEIHPSLENLEGGHSRSISNETLDMLHSTIQKLHEEKRERMLKLQDLGESLIELWDLMDTPSEDQNCFQHVTCHLAATEDEITTPGALSFEVMEQAEMEVERLSHLKVSKMKELVLKKRAELEDICRRAHMECDSNATEDKIIALIDSGMIDSSDLLSSMEDQIGKAKEEAFSRKEIMEKIERWMAACEEESWLEEYNKDENRYSASRGAHLNLKRAERARVTVSKLPALVESLRSKAKSWQDERGTPFYYDGVSLLAMLEEYNHLRQEKEEEKRRMRDHKRIQEQLITEQEVLFGTRPSPIKTGSIKKHSKPTNGTPSSRRLSLGGANANIPSTPDHCLTTRVNGISRLGTKENSKKDRVLRAHTVTKEDPSTVIHIPERKPLTPVPQPSSKTNVIDPFNTVKIVSTNNTRPDQQLTEYHLPEPSECTPRPSEYSPRLSEYTPRSSEYIPRRDVAYAPREMEYSFEERRLLCLTAS